MEGGFAGTREQLQCIEAQRWLDDLVYIHLIVEDNRLNMNLPKVYEFGTQFCTKLEAGEFSGVANWTKNVEMFIGAWQ